MDIESTLADELDYTYSEACDVEAGSESIETVSPLQSNLVYYNNLGEDIIVVDRSGVPMKLNSQPGNGGGFIAERKYHIGRGVDIDPNGLSRYNGGARKERKVINEVMESVSKSDSMVKQASIRYRITREKLLEEEYPLYIPEIDLVVAIPRLHEARKIVHPYSDVAAVHKLLEKDIMGNGRTMCKYQIVIVSNDRTYGDRYVNLLGDIYKVPSIVNKSLHDGVHICSSGVVASGNGRRPSSYRDYSFEDVGEHIALYKTIDEARTFGDPDGEREREFKRLEHEFKEIEHGYKRDKLKLENEIHEQKLKRDEAALEREELTSQLEHYRKMKELRDKDYYDDRSRVRKDNSEIVKYIPSILTGIFALVTIAVKFSNK